MLGRKELLLVLAPRGCAEVFLTIGNFLRCYRDTIPFRISCKGIGPRDVLQIAGMTIEAYPVVHCGSIKDDEILEQIPAMGYRISSGGEIVAITGDTGSSSCLEELVSGADLAILEATIGKGEKARDEMLEKVHLSEDLASEIGKLAKKFILVHRSPE
jgi:ribonuclease BN (tRNA processing enzyme)